MIIILHDKQNTEIDLDKLLRIKADASLYITYDDDKWNKFDYSLEEEAQKDYIGLLEMMCYRTTNDPVFFSDRFRGRFLAETK